MYDFGFRYYDPLTAAWIGKDLVPADHNAPLSLNEFLYCLVNPLMFVDPDGREAIVWVKVANPQQPRYESAAIVYPNDTIPNFEAIKGLNFDQVIEKFGKPLSIQKNLSSLPDSEPGKPSKFGTVAEGEYEYSKSKFKGKPALLLPVRVPQDENVNNGLNPRYGTGSKKRDYLEGVYAHTGWFGPLNACVQAGSEGCLTGWDGDNRDSDIFSKFMNSLKDPKGTIFVSRPKY